LIAMPVHPRRDLGFIASFLVTVLTDSLKIRFGYQLISVILRVQIYSSCAASSSNRHFAGIKKAGCFYPA